MNSKLLKNVTDRLSNRFERLSVHTSSATASTVGFLVAVGMVVAWALTGPLFHFSDRWMEIICLITSLCTFLMVFLLQRAQNKGMLALHLKLNELIASQQGASNKMVNIESATESELANIRDLHDKLPKDSLDSHSFEHVRDSEIVIVQR